MRTLTFIFEDKTGCGAPLDCGCGGVYIHLRPLATLAVRTAPTAPGANLLYGTISTPPENLGDIDADCKNEWQYSIDIDETQLINPNEPITSCDVEEICCEDCSIKVTTKMITAIGEYELERQSDTICLVNDITGSESCVPITVYTCDSIDGDGTISSPLCVNISDDEGNDLTTGIDGGLYVDADNLPISVCAALDGDGTVGDPLCISPSADAGNRLTIGIDSKLYVPPVDTDDSLDGDGSSGDPLKITPSTTVNNIIVISGDDGKPFACGYTNETQGQANSAGAVTAIDALGTYTIYTGPVMTFDNALNACRSQVILTVGDNTLQAELLTVGVWQVRVEESYNGGAFTAVATAQYGDFGAVYKGPLLLPVFEVYSVPAAGTISIQRRIVVQTLTPSAVGSQITSYALGIRAIRVST